MPLSIEDVLARTRVVPVVTIGDLRAAVPLARALRDGGLRVIEIALRTAGALAAIRAVSAELEDAVVGAGTVLSAARLDDAVAAGARFVVTPGTPAALLRRLVEAPVPGLPRVQTVSEMLAARAAGFRCLKFFPAEAAGGCAVLTAVANVLPDLRFCPTGGIGPDNAGAYLKLANVACVGGSWMAPSDLIAAGDFKGIEARARAAAAL